MGPAKISITGDVTPWVYILICGDGSLYTGMTTDLRKRLLQHQQKKARCKFTRRSDKHPIRLGAAWKLSGQRGHALILENFIKKMSRTEKLTLLQDKAMLRTIIDREVLMLPCELTPYKGDLYDLEEA